jgi:hypothetical protein
MRWTNQGCMYCIEVLNNALYVSHTETNEKSFTDMNMYVCIIYNDG